MTDREKLIALYDKAIQYAGGMCAGHGCDTCLYGECEGDCYEAAKFDYLLANGVVVREKGEWHPNGTFGPHHMEIVFCPICKRLAEGSVSDNFCPHCGSDMRRGERVYDRPI